MDRILVRNDTLFRREPKNVSISLYDQLPDDSNRDRLAERILLLFADDRGIYKRTYSQRFEGFDREACTALTQSFDSSDPLLIHDVGVSDGRTAVDFFERVAAVFPKLRYVASDRMPFIEVVARKRLIVALSPQGEVMEITFPPFVFNMSKSDDIWHYPLNHLIRLVLERTKVRSLLRRLARGELKPRTVQLVAPQALRTARHDSRFVLQQHDILSPFDQQNHVVRAMNILNPKYFSQNRFGTVIQNLHGGLFDGGLLVTGSNQEAGTDVDGAVYRKVGDLFELVWQSGSGSPVHRFIRGLD